MAHDDMHVIIYKILAYLYACLKRGDAVDVGAISCEALGINRTYWTEVVASLSARGYVKGVTVAHSQLGDAVYMGNPRITIEGVEFLMENSMMQRAMAFLRDVKESVPGL